MLAVFRRRGLKWLLLVARAIGRATKRTILEKHWQRINGRDYAADCSANAPNCGT
jgi:hypothetical protein